MHQHISTKTTRTTLAVATTAVFAWALVSAGPPTDIDAEAERPARSPLQRDTAAVVELATEPVAGQGTGPAQVLALTASTAPDGQSGVPENVLRAYRSAAARMSVEQPGCRLAWFHLAGIGKVESGHARGGRAVENGDTVPHILGPALNGDGFAAIPDTDAGAYDGDRAWDRAVGPMQFIPSTWRSHGADGNGDGVADPHNVMDATLGAARYLCSGGIDLGTPEGLRAAVFRYNRSESYVHMVETWMSVYSRNVVSMPADWSGPVPYPSDPASTSDGQEAVAAPAPAPVVVPPAPPAEGTPDDATPPVTAPEEDPDPAQEDGGAEPTPDPVLDVPLCELPVVDGVVSELTDGLLGGLVDGVLGSSDAECEPKDEPADPATAPVHQENGVTEPEQSGEAAPGLVE